MEFNSIEALEIEEKRLWAIVQERSKAKEAAALEWHKVRMQIAKAREQARVESLVEERLREKEKVNVKTK